MHARPDSRQPRPPQQQQQPGGPIDREEYIPKDNINAAYYNKEFDFDRSREREGSANDAIAEYDAYIMHHSGPGSGSSSDESRPLSFEQWYRKKTKRYYTDVDTSDSGYQLEAEWYIDGQRYARYGFTRDPEGNRIPTRNDRGIPPRSARGIPRPQPASSNTPASLRGGSAYHAPDQPDQNNQFRDGASHHYDSGYGHRSSDHRRYTPPHQEHTPATNSQLTRLLGSTPDAARAWHSGTEGARGDVMAGCTALSQSNLRQLRVPTDYSLEIIKGHFSLIANWSRYSRSNDDSYSSTYG